jgi:hypothetical protein
VIAVPTRLPVWAVLALAACAQPQEPKPAPRPDPACPFDLSQPTRSFELPDELHELSAITVVDGHSIACVQDEKGVLFWFDLGQGRVTAAQRFGEHGDYEGLARADPEYYVLRRDGLLLRLGQDGKHLRTLAETPLGLPVPEIEGICKDPRGDRLLIAPKEFGKVSKERRDERPLFAFDLVTQRASPEPVMTISIAAVEAAALRLGVELPMRSTPKGKERIELLLHFSDLAVRPATGDVFLLSSVDHLLLVVSPTGAVRFVHHLDEVLLPQPESIAFLPDGDLLLGSEGASGKAALCRYRLQR